MQANIYAANNRSQLIGDTILADGAVTLQRLDHQCVRGRVSFAGTFETNTENVGRDLLTTLVPDMHTYESIDDMVAAHKLTRVPKHLYALRSDWINILPEGALRSALEKHSKFYGAQHFAVFLA